MKFKINLSKENSHKGIVSCLDWSHNDELYSVGDDHQILKWNTKTRENVPFAKLPEDFIPTSLHCIKNNSIGIGNSGVGTSIGHGSNVSGIKGIDSLLITSTDGRFIILNKNARVEKIINAHQSTSILADLSPDGAGLFTAGEDGIIKIWSKSGMLRSTFVQNENAIKCAKWSPNSQSIAYCQTSFITIKSLLTTGTTSSSSSSAVPSKLIKWKAHDGYVICLSWSQDTFLLASGGEDNRYKIWDNQGSNIFSSLPEDYPITAIEFSPNGHLLAVGSFNTIKLCNYTGWMHNNKKLNTPIIGSIFSICWSQDGTQISAGTSIGYLLFGHVIEEERVHQNLRAITTGRKTIQLQNILTHTNDTLDFPDRIINWDLGYGHLIVATTTQIHIYNEKYINTPLAIIDRRANVRIIILGKKYFLIVDYSGIWIYTYNGRLHLNPKFNGIQTQLGHLNSKLISFGLYFIAVRDFIDQTVIHIFDLLPSATRQNELQVIQTKESIIQVAVCRAGNTINNQYQDQYIGFIDKNNDLFITIINNGDSEIYKIGTQVMAILWGSEANILVGLHDSCYSIWYCPGESCGDPTLIALTTITYDISEFGKNVQLGNFDGPNITFLSSANYSIMKSQNIYCEILHRFLMDDMWIQALKLCRRVQNSILWATLAAVASKKNNIDISEEAYSAALQIDKVNYLQYIKNLPHSSPEQMAENSIIMGRIKEAETILIHNKKIKEAIQLCIRMHKWERALDIAENHKLHIDMVLEERKKYLITLNKQEFDKKFLKNYTIT